MAASSADGLGPRVFLADGDARLRSLMRELLEVEGCVVVGEAAMAGEVSVLVPLATARPLVLVIEVRIAGDVNGIEATRRLLAAGLPLGVVVLTSIGDGATERVARAAGAVGFVEKGTRGDVLVSAVRAAWRGLAGARGGGDGAFDAV